MLTEKDTVNLAFLGFGHRMKAVVDVLKAEQIPFRITAIHDHNEAQARLQLESVGVEAHSVQFFPDPETLLGSGLMDAVLVGTHCNSHARLAVAVMRMGLPLFLEKPVGITALELDLLEKQAGQAELPVVVSFPLRMSPIVRQAQSIIQSGRAGRITHVQVLNNVPYGGVYYHNWYRDRNLTGGLFLQKATHDFDVVNFLLQDQPTEIMAMTSQSVFKGLKPAGLRCVECPEKDFCPEGPRQLSLEKQEAILGPYCCFAEDNQTEDSGSALVRYSSGLHLAYSQNFYSRKSAQRRFFNFISYDATLSFDFYLDQLILTSHGSRHIESHECFSADLPHFGGDRVLIKNFIDVVHGRALSESPLSAGILSARMCLAAAQSELDQKVCLI